MTKKERRENGGVHLLALLQEAAKLGLTTEVRGGGEALCLEFILTHGLGGAHREVVGTATVWVAGAYNGVRGMASARGLGIELLRRVGWPEDVLRPIELLKGWPENTKTQQRAALERCRVEMQRRQDYLDAMEAGELDAPKPAEGC